MSNFTHLHLHTEYSLLDGTNNIKRLAKKLHELGMPSVGISDHGCLFGALDFYITMLGEGIKPIIGIETYIHNNDDLSAKEPLRFHLCLFAKNYEGYKNLMYLSSQAYLNGFYKNPRINKKLLKERANGLICSSACLQGEVNYHLNTNKPDAKGYEHAKKVALEYKEIFGEDFYLEIMRHGIKEQQFIDNKILQLSKETGIKIIATNDTHYTNKKDSFYQEVTMCISTGKKLEDKNRLKHSVNEFYIKSKSQMARLFADIPEALENTQEIVEKCNLELDLKSTEIKNKNGEIILKNTPPRAPRFKFTQQYARDEGLDMSDDEEYFRHKCEQGLKERLKNIDESMHAKYRERLKYEMDVIAQMKFPGYMLIVWDFVREAKAQHIPVGPGRGSAAGSLVAFCLNITDIDPIKHDLLFERFLNPERVSMPDIDMDFSKERRDEIIEYVKNKYGQNNVSQVVTFNTMSAKSVVRDVTRVFGIEYKEANEFAKLIPDAPKIKLQTGEKLDKSKMGAFELEPKIGEKINSSKLWQEIWDTSLALENQKRNVGIHAAAVVIDSDEELWNKIPLCIIKDKVATQYSMDYLEKVNLIKFDFLGLKTLTVIQKTLDLLDEKIDFNNIDLNDPKVYQAIQSGETIGMFQIESSGMRSLNKRLKTNSFSDLIAVAALYRPGPLESGMVDDFIARKHGHKKIEYLFDALEDILKDTYGVIVYQEQVMQIVQVIGGFSLGQADIIRRAMGKKKLEEMTRRKEEFAQGAASQGYDKQKAQELWELIVKFAGYGFNKSHSAAYAMIAFQTAYLKTYHRHEFMAALLSSEKNNVDNINLYIQECRNMGIEVLPPHVNYSLEDFSVKDFNGVKKIIFGLSAIKGLGSNPIKNIVDSRGADGFKSLEEFISKMDSKVVNKKVLESLIKSGAIGGFEYSLKCLYNNMDLLADIIRNNTKALELTNAQDSLFKDIEAPNTVTLNLKNEPEFPRQKLFDFEYEILGIFMRGNPLENFISKIDATKGVVFSHQYQHLKNDSHALIVGFIKEIKEHISKKGNRYAEMLLIDKIGSINIQVFEKNLAQIHAAPKDEPICLRCRASESKDMISLQLEKIIKFEDMQKERVNPEFKDEDEFVSNTYHSDESPIIECDFCIQIPCNATFEVLKKIQTLARENPGGERLVLSVILENTKYDMPSSYKINDNFKAKVKEFICA